MTSFQTLRVIRRTTDTTYPYAGSLFDAGDTRFLVEITNRESLISEIKGDAGPQWWQSPSALTQILAAQTEIAEIEREAMDRYRDLATD